MNEIQDGPLTYNEREPYFKRSSPNEFTFTSHTSDHYITNNRDDAINQLYFGIMIQSSEWQQPTDTVATYFEYGREEIASLLFTDASQIISGDYIMVYTDSDVFGFWFDRGGGSAPTSEPFNSIDPMNKMIKT